jgi:ketosteroid isomerase-like protein
LKILFTAVLLSLFLAIPAFPADSSAQETKLIALENAWNQAQLSKDAKALNELVGERFVYTDTDGTMMNKAAFLADAKNPSYHATSASNEDVAVYLYDSFGVVTGRYHTKGTYNGKAFDHRGRFTDTWLRRGDNWQCVARVFAIRERFSQGRRS